MKSRRQGAARAVWHSATSVTAAADWLGETQTVAYFAFRGDLALEAPGCMGALVAQKVDPEFEAEAAGVLGRKVSAAAVRGYEEAFEDLRVAVLAHRRAMAVVERKLRPLLREQFPAWSGSLETLLVPELPPLKDLPLLNAAATVLEIQALSEGLKRWCDSPQRKPRGKGDRISVALRRAGEEAVLRYARGKKLTAPKALAVVAVWLGVDDPICDALGFHELCKRWSAVARNGPTFLISNGTRGAGGSRTMRSHETKPTDTASTRQNQARPHAA